MATKKTKETISKIVNWNNYKPSPGEYNSGELLVVPDQAYSIEEIFDKFRRGISLPIELPTYYPDDEPDFDDLDLRQVAKDVYDIDETNALHYHTKRAKRAGQGAKANSGQNTNERSVESATVQSEAKATDKASEASEAGLQG